MNSQKKIKIGIFDLTDCEGCQLEFFNLYEKFLDLVQNVEIVNWRLVKEKKVPFAPSLDVGIVEGTPMTEKDLRVLKEARAQSKLLIALGACAAIGGINSALSTQERKKAKKRIYNQSYYLRTKYHRPVSDFVKVDLEIPGCPVEPADIERVLAKIILEIVETDSAAFPVCLECKKNQNDCFLQKGQLCFGPITKGGCDATCVNNLFPCLGCRGLLAGANLKAFLKTLKINKISSNDFQRKKKIFLQNELKDN